MANILEKQLEALELLANAIDRNAEYLFKNAKMHTEIIRDEDEDMPVLYMIVG